VGKVFVRLFVYGDGGELRIALEGSLSLVRGQMCRPRELKALVEMPHRLLLHFLTFSSCLDLIRY
jgi:hypothetical protein